MLRRVLRSGLASVPMRFKPQQKPELKVDFVRYPYGNSPVRITGMWTIDHGGYDYASESMDYEDHGMTMLHQRPTHWRSSWVIFVGVASLALTYYITQEMPFVGIVFGQSYMDIEMNAIKHLNDNEEIHDWDALKKQWLELKAKSEAEEE